MIDETFLCGPYQGCITETSDSVAVESVWSCNFENREAENLEVSGTQMKGNFLRLKPVLSSG
jgi:hypothetical protein